MLNFEFRGISWLYTGFSSNNALQAITFHIFDSYFK